MQFQKQHLGQFRGEFFEQFNFFQVIRAECPSGTKCVADFSCNENANFGTVLQIIFGIIFETIFGIISGKISGTILANKICGQLCGQFQGLFWGQFQGQFWDDFGNNFRNNVWDNFGDNFSNNYFFFLYFQVFVLNAPQEQNVLLNFFATKMLLWLLIEST